MNVVTETPPITQNEDGKNKIQQKNRRSFLLMLAVFALPIVLAKFALEGEWLATGVTNNGALLSQELTIAQLGLDKAAYDKQWLIIYNIPQQCDIGCQKTLTTVHNTYVALGKEMPRVTPLALYQNELANEHLQQLSKSQWQLTTMPSQAERYLDSQKLFISGPLGNGFLSHQIPNNAEQLPQFGKQILADMKKLLKYSKVG